MYRVQRLPAGFIWEGKTSSSVSSVESDVYLIVQDTGASLVPVARATTSVLAAQIAAALNAAA